MKILKFKIIIFLFFLKIYAVTAQPIYLRDTSYLYVEDFGAKGDGKTDDSKAIQRAIDSAISKMKSLKFQARTYLVNSQLETRNTGKDATRKYSVKIFGYPGGELDRQLTVIQAGAPMESIMVLRTYTEIADIGFSAGYKSNNCLRLRGCSNSTFKNCGFYDARQNGVLLNAPSDPEKGTNPYVSGNTVIDYSDSCHYHINDNNNFENCAFVTNGHRISNSSDSRLLFSQVQRNTIIKPATIKAIYSDTVVFSNINLLEFGIQTGDFIQIDTNIFNKETFIGQYAIRKIIDSNKLLLGKKYKDTSSLKSVLFSIGIGSHYRENTHTDNNTNDIIGGLARQSGASAFRFSSQYGPNVTRVQFDSNLFPAIFIGILRDNSNICPVTFGARIAGNYFGDSRWECPLALGCGVYYLEAGGLFINSYPGNVKLPPILYTTDEGAYIDSYVRGSQLYPAQIQSPWRDDDTIYTISSEQSLISKIFSRGLYEGRLVGDVSFGQPVRIDWADRGTLKVVSFHLILTDENVKKINSDTTISTEHLFMKRKDFDKDDPALILGPPNGFDDNTQGWVRVTNELRHSITLLGNDAFPKTGLSLPSSQVTLEVGESAVFMENGASNRTEPLKWRLAYIESKKGNAFSVKKYDSEENLPSIVNHKWNNNNINDLSGNLAYQDNRKQLKVFDGQNWNDIIQERLVVLSPLKDSSVAISNETTIMANAANGKLTLMLPLAKEAMNKKISFVKTDISNNKISIKPQQNETINGLSVFEIKDQFQNFTVVTDGKSSWYIVK